MSRCSTARNKVSYLIDSRERKALHENNIPLER